MSQKNPTKLEGGGGMPCGRATKKNTFFAASIMKLLSLA